MEQMRDLDQIQERDPDEAGRRVGTLVMATIAFVGLSTAVGVVLGRAARPAAEDQSLDPLAALGAGSVANRAATAAPATDDKADAALKVDKASLRFPNALTDAEDRPEVLAALAAAAVEEAALVDAPLSHPGHAPSATAPANLDAVASTERIPAAMPASVSAGPAGRALAQAAKYDPLVEASIPEGPARSERARRGKEGDFNLQVASYETEEQAKALAEGLRAKGHEAFVTRADIPERGVYFRVRIGPFESRWRANLYRTKFEAAEQMNTYVVRRPKEKRIKNTQAADPALAKP